MAMATTTTTAMRIAACRIRLMASEIRERGTLLAWAERPKSLGW
jgi:hypothetical protein